MSHNTMIIGLWNGEEKAMQEMREYMKNHNFAKIEDAGHLYHSIMNHIGGLYSATDARLLYEAYLGLPDVKSEYNPGYRAELVQRFSAYGNILNTFVLIMKKRLEDNQK